MRRFAANTSCLIAAFSTWHPNHATTLSFLEQRLARGFDFCVVTHTAIETYSVLTRLPSPHRLSTTDAWKLVEANLAHRTQLQMSPQQALDFLKGSSENLVSGGRTYDGLIAETARLGGVELLLTWNLAHFQAFATEDFRVQSPVPTA